MFTAWGTNVLQITVHNWTSFHLPVYNLERRL